MPNMKTFGAVLIVLGLLVSLVGYGQYEHVMCNCIATVGGSPIGCHCGNVLQQSIGHILVYAGLAIAGSGMIVFAKWWRKKIIFN
ncbi:MAG: hypothetical protein KGI10_07930 [Thaumarchaeota archaeon]|nr:hypothetical protein [Nitrososphaerota archaeon]